MSTYPAFRKDGEERYNDRFLPPGKRVDRFSMHFARYRELTPLESGLIAFSMAVIAAVLSSGVYLVCKYLF